MNNPFVMVIFGATGDLARHKLFPALFSLYKRGELGEKFFIIGFARRPFSDAEFAELVKKDLQVTDSAWNEFAKNLYYQQGTFDGTEGYEGLISRLGTFDTEMGACITRYFYLATPPDHYQTILDHLASTELSEGCGQGSNKWTRLIIEKPFGKDLDTAVALDAKLSHIFVEKQIFRVDHYLGKETVQNLLAFRFANSIFEPIWNNQFIDHVQITWAEEAGVGARGNFFEGVGMLRDVAQNHLLQLLAAVAMEQPSSFSREGVRDARAAAINAIDCLTPDEVREQVVRGQYQGYHEEKHVAADSRTETFVGMKLFVDTPRFRDVPFYLRAGKQMEKNLIEISVVFIQTCHLLFKEYGCPEVGNVLTFRIQPNEGITMRVIAKKPGPTLALDPVEMKFSYHETFGNHGIDAYEKVLLDIFHDDQMLFNRSDELASSWQLITNILKSWENDASPIASYQEGSMGPESATELIEKEGRKWL